MSCESCGRHRPLHRVRIGDRTFAVCSSCDLRSLESERARGCPEYRNTHPIDVVDRVVDVHAVRRDALVGVTR